MLSSRAMTIEDLEQVLSIEYSTFSNPWSKSSFVNELTHNDHSRYLVLLSDDCIVAYGGIWHVLDEAHITTIAVDPKFQRQGLGQIMLELLLTKAVSCGAADITLEVRESNLAAIKLYQKNGFFIGGRRVRYYSDNNEDALVMWKRDINKHQKIKKMVNKNA